MQKKIPVRMTISAATPSRLAWLADQLGTDAGGVVDQLALSRIRAEYGHHKTVSWACIDKPHNVWMCRNCGYINKFEADGPVENGWSCCPHCRKTIRRK